jgi:hypothetical protein
MHGVEVVLYDEYALVGCGIGLERDDGDVTYAFFSLL